MVWLLLAAAAAAAAAADISCDDLCVVGAHGYDELLRRMSESDKSCSSYAMQAVDPNVHRVCGGGSIATIVETCATDIDPQCYRHESAAVAYIVTSNAVGAIVWIALATVALRETRRRRAATQ